MRRILVLLLIIVAAAGAVFGQSLPAIPEGKCRVTFFAWFSTPLPFATNSVATFSVDGSKQFSISMKDAYAIFDLDPGYHVVQASWDNPMSKKDDEYTDTTRFYLSAGKAAHVRFAVWQSGAISVSAEPARPSDYESRKPLFLALGKE